MPHCRHLFCRYTYLKIYLFDCLQILQTTTLGAQLWFLWVTELGPIVIQYYELLPSFDIHFVSGADLENYCLHYSHIAHT